ncbi:MAG: M3 family metallopeptidase [Woeseiaceae bacterium]
MSNPLLDISELPRFGDISPEHVQPALDQLIAEHKEKLAALLHDTEAHDFDSLVTPLEEMNHELSRMWSPVSHLQSVLDASGWREAYNAALPPLTRHRTEISQNTKLQQAFERVSESISGDAPTAKRTLVDHALRDFRLAGVALPDDQKKRFRELMQELATVQASFDQNVQDATDSWHFHTEDEAQLAGLPEQASSRARRDAEQRGLKGAWLSLDPPTYQAVLTHVEDRSVREVFYRAWSTRASDQGIDRTFDNSRNIDKILSLRHAAAKLIGFDNYAEYSLATKMAAEPNNVIEFLSELASRSRATAETELETITAIASHELAAWDIAFYTDKLKQEKFAISNDTLRQYFPVSRVLSGLFGLVEKLYGISIAKVDDIPKWHDSVRYYELRERSGAVVGGFYADLYARNGKRGGAWVDECVVRKNLNGEFVLPVGHLVCNFSPPDERGCSSLTHEDVITLFHEFGHMLHHLLTRVDYPSLAGINGVPWDAVELPSQFMENFAWCYDVLVQASGHFDSGEPLPKELFQKLEASRHCGAGMAMLRQIEFALFDFRLHANFDRENRQNPLQVLEQVRDEVSLVAHPEYNRLPHSFTHIFAGGYAAGYYSYKWAEVLAADAFAAFEESGIFDRQTARRFRSEILEIGGSKDIMKAFIAFRGRKPTMDALLRMNGIGLAA